MQIFWHDGSFFFTAYRSGNISFGSGRTVAFDDIVFGGLKGCVFIIIIIIIIVVVVVGRGKGDVVVRAEGEITEWVF